MTDEEIKARIQACKARVKLVRHCALQHLESKRGAERQNELLALASIGLPDREIARVLCVSPETVSTYWTRLLKTLGATSRTEAVAIVLEREIATLSSGE